MEENKLPIKTKIASILIIIIGLLFFGYSIIALLTASIEGWKIHIYDYLLFLPAIFTFLISFYLIKRKKLAFIISIIMLTFLLIFLTVAFVYYVIGLNNDYHRVSQVQFESMIEHLFINGLAIYLICLVPFILLLSDRKNFFKIAS